MINALSVRSKFFRRSIVCFTVVGLGMGVAAANAQAATGTVQTASAATLPAQAVSVPENALGVTVPAGKAVDWWNHPALKPLEKAVPDPTVIIPNRDRWINRLSEGKLYSAVNDASMRLRDVYELDPDGWGGFTYRTAVKPRDGVPTSVYSSAMGVDDQNRTVLYYTEKPVFSRYKIRKAVDGANNIQELPEIKPEGTGCWISNTGVSPNGSLWISAGRVGAGNNAGRNTLSLVNSNGTTTSSQRFEPEAGTVPLNSGDCLYGGVFDEEGNYYVRAGDGCNSSSNDIIKLDLSGFPARVTYSRIDLPIANRGQGLAWYDNSWWSAPPKNTREPLYQIDPTNGIVSNTTAGVLNPYSVISSTNIVKPANLTIDHQVNVSSVLGGGTATYTVTVKNDINVGFSYSGPVVVDLGKLSPNRYQFQKGTSQVVDAVNMSRNKGRIVGNAPDGYNKLTWVGNIPNGGQLTLTYIIKFGDEAGDFSSTVLPPEGLPSNCSPGRTSQRQCTASVKVLAGGG